MIPVPPEIITGFAALLEQVEPLLFLARDRKLQEQAIVATKQFLERVEQMRLAAIGMQNEPEANELLGLSMTLKALASELGVYVLLKADQAEDAWDRLIDAQDQIAAAARASKAIPNLGKKFDHLRSLESALFPPQNFLSAGLIVRRHECSICGTDYQDCDHIVGKPYMGRFCAVILKEVSADHIAFVDAPADRRCRVISFGVPGGTRNKMTWIVTPTEGGGDSDN